MSLSDRYMLPQCSCAVGAHHAQTTLAQRETLSQLFSQLNLNYECFTLFETSLTDAPLVVVHPGQRTHCRGDIYFH